MDEHELLDQVAKLQIIIKESDRKYEVLCLKN